MGQSVIFGQTGRSLARCKAVLGHASNLPVLQLYMEDFFLLSFSHGFVAKERAQALETLQCFITGTMDCKGIAGKMQSFKQWPS